MIDNDDLPPPAAFDRQMTALEAIVAQLETGDLPLEQALQAFEQGVHLVRDLTGKLNAAEARVELLARGVRSSLTPEAIADANGD